MENLIKPLHIRRQELSNREGSKIISKGDQILIKKSWLNWKDEIENEKFLSPFGKIQIQLEDMSSETGTTTFNIEPEFSFEDSLQPSKRRPEYWDRLGSSKPRKEEQQNEQLGNSLKTVPLFWDLFTSHFPMCLLFVFIINFLCK